MSRLSLAFFGAVLVGLGSILLGEHVANVLPNLSGVYPWLGPNEAKLIASMAKPLRYFAAGATIVLVFWGIFDLFFRDRKPYFKRSRILVVLLVLGCAGYSFGYMVKPFASYSYNEIRQLFMVYPTNVVFVGLWLPALFALVNICGEKFQGSQDYEDRHGASPVVELAARVTALTDRIDQRFGLLYQQHGFSKNDDGSWKNPTTTTNAKLTVILQLLGAKLDREKKTWNQPERNLSVRFDNLETAVKKIRKRTKGTSNDIALALVELGYHEVEGEEDLKRPATTLRARLDELDQRANAEFLTRFDSAMDGIFALARRINETTANTHKHLTNGAGDQSHSVQSQG